MFPILFSIGKINFYSYGLMASIAFLATTGVTLLIAKKQNQYSDVLFDQLILVFIFALIGARLGYFILYSNQFLHWYEVFYPWQGALLSFGGIIGAIIGIIIIFNRNALKWLDIVGVSFLAGLFFWRMGCFLAGDHEQVASNAIWAINGQFPAILVEALSGLVGFSIFYFLYNKICKYYGMTFYLVIIYYGLVRLFVDGYRMDPMIYGLKTGQFTGLAFILIGLTAIISSVLWQIKLNNKDKNVKKIK